MISQRLQLDPVVPEDWKDYAPILKAPETARFSDLPRKVTDKRCAAFVAWMAGLNAKGRGRAWMIRYRGASEIVGAIRLNRIDKKTAIASVGYELAETHWGHGVMREALAAVVEHAHGSLALYRLEAWALAENTRSHKVLEAAGSRREGCQRHKFLRDGVRSDMCLYGRLREDGMPDGSG